MGRWPFFFKKSKRTLLLALPGHQFRGFWVTSPVIYITVHNETNPAKYSFLNFFFKHSLLDSCLWRSKWIAIHLYSLGVERWLVQWYSCFLLTEHTCVLKSMEKCRWIIHKKFWMKWFLKRKGFEFHLKKKKINLFL